MPKILVALIMLAASLTPMATAASTASTAANTLSESAPVYLALGDSLAFGYGASDPETTGYVPLVHDALRRTVPCHPGDTRPCGDLQLLNLAESGATTDSLIDTQLPTALEVIADRNGDDDPDNDVVAITVDIGGNDAVGGVFEACAESVTLACGGAVQDTLGTVSRNLTSIMMRLRAAAGPDTRIAVMTYFNGLIACDYRESADNAELVLEGIPGVTPGLNGIIRQVADRADALVVDTFGMLGAEDLVGGVDCLHANDTGYEKIATAFTDVLSGIPKAGSS